LVYSQTPTSKLSHRIFLEHAREKIPVIEGS
jgi:hypothetical protein